MKLIIALFAFAGALLAQNPSPCTTVQNAATSGQVLSAATSGRPPQCRWITGGGGGGGVSQVTGTLPIQVANTTTTPVVSCRTATGLVSGCLSAADWATFNGKQGAGSYITALTGDVTATGPGSVAATIANNAVTTAKILDANVTAAKMVNAGVFTGDVTTTFPAITVAKVNGISYPSTGAAHSIPVVTTANTTATYKVLPDCTDTGGNHLNFTQSTDAFSCGTSGGGATTYIREDFIPLTICGGDGQAVQYAPGAGSIVGSVPAGPGCGSGRNTGLPTFGYELFNASANTYASYLWRVPTGFNAFVSITYHWSNDTATKTNSFRYGAWCPSTTEPWFTGSGSPSFTDDSIFTGTSNATTFTFTNTIHNTTNVDGCAAGGLVIFKIGREGTDGSDNGGSNYFIGVTLRYTVNLP